MIKLGPYDIVACVSHVLLPNTSQSTIRVRDTQPPLPLVMPEQLELLT